MNNCIENYQVSIQKINLAKYFPFTYFCIKMLYKFSEIVIIMMSQSFAMHVVYFIIHKFFYNAWLATTYFRTSVADFGCIMYENQLLHVVIGF